ncbi:(2,3-dihydroxybenzoyl)adenylate synthase [Curtanaerobium respiraculi]|uniref:(2,3-dihydroxybenzoyl)adenylate synthase n=1 Tax=Curtanaerobium respiraculi TaxID=2949669 RepID=UPI0024B3A1BF|nr:AMP-binding protein [Curtanaerobium respiraculi]
MKKDFIEFPSERAHRYIGANAWEGQVFRTHFDRWCSDFDQRVALCTLSQTITYGELKAMVRTVASHCLTRGHTPQERIVVQMRNDIPSLAVFFGVMYAGCIPALSLGSHQHRELEHIAKASGATTCFLPDEPDFDQLKHSLTSGTASLEVIAHSNLLLPPPSKIPLPDAATGVSPTAPMLLLLSGGTTGLPKLIPRTHNDYFYNCRLTIGRCKLTCDDVYLAALPIAHNFPLNNPGILGTLATGGQVVLASSPSPDEAFALIERYGVTFTSLVPSLASLWGEAIQWYSPDLSSLRLVQVGGAPFPPAHYDRAASAFGCWIQQVFGMAEGLICLTGENDPADLARTYQGTPISHLDEIRIVDVEGDEVPAGAEGELLVRGPYTINGYFANPQVNAKSFTDDGFFRSGDLATFNPQGQLRITGRIKNVINRGGEKISGEEVEELVEQIPHIKAAAAMGIPDSLLGERICVFVVCDGGAPTLARMRAYLKGCSVPDYKLPDQMMEVAALPTTAIGKVDLKKLKALVS